MSTINNEAVSFLGTDTPVKIYNKNDSRTFLSLYSVSGSCYFNIGDNDFEKNARLLTDGDIWEPSKVPTSSIWFKGNNARLTALVGGDRPIVPFD